MEMQKQLLDRFQLIVYTVLFVLSSVLLLGGLFWVIKSLPVFAVALIMLFALIMGIVIYSYIYVIFSIPQDMAGSYDELKNNISNGSIREPADFAKQLNSFLIEFFSYSFFNIKYSSTQLVTKEVVVSSEEISGCFDWNELDKQCQQTESLISLGKVEINKEKLFAYALPVCFENKYLGYITVFCTQRQGAMHKKFLMDFENYYLDDQLVRLTLKN